MVKTIATGGRRLMVILKRKRDHSLIWLKAMFVLRCGCGVAERAAVGCGGSAAGWLAAECREAAGSEISIAAAPPDLANFFFRSAGLIHCPESLDHARLELE